MFNPTRDQVRRFFSDTWAKYQKGQPLEGAETVALQTILEHPEYHVNLEHIDTNIDRDFTPESGTPNPFLHLSLHLAIEEQLSIDQPPGIRGQCAQLATRLGDEHAAKHALLECLAETIWSAQRSGVAVDPQQYADCVARRLES
jgi:hypothetical protein